MPHPCSAQGLAGKDSVPSRLCPGSSLLLKGQGRHSHFTDGAAEAGVNAQGHTASRWRSWDLSPSLCLGLPQHRRPLWETEAGGGS